MHVNEKKSLHQKRLNYIIRIVYNNVYFIIQIDIFLKTLLKLAYTINQSKYNSGRPTFKQQKFHSKVN
jgi:hypothetical protein